MPFVKVQKNKAYYKRLQVKYRRRKSGKTDYYARRKMVAQAKNKYNTPKYRLVVRKTNKKVICQVVYATIMGDRVLCQATSDELKKYGVPCGYTNYAACYATGLLIARRALTVVGMADVITGVTECTAEEFHVEDDEETDRRPFKAILDVGMTRTISGARCFGVLKGAVDGGLHVPHTVKKFPGYKEPEERGADYEYDAGAHLERIIGTHIVEYQEMLKEEDPDKFQAEFKNYIENDIEPDGIEDMYKECHGKIRADPAFVKKESSGITNKRNGSLITTSKGTEYTRMQKLSKSQRQQRVKQKFDKYLKKVMAAADDDDE